jgi:rhodanese-related sulfurtransferase
MLRFKSGNGVQVHVWKSTAPQEGDGTMPIPISRDEVLRLMRDERAQLVEVLPHQEYEDEHIAGAVNIPLKRIGNKSVSRLEKGLPVIVY